MVDELLQPASIPPIPEGFKFRVKAVCQLDLAQVLIDSLGEDLAKLQAGMLISRKIQALTEIISGVRLGIVVSIQEEEAREEIDA